MVSGINAKPKKYRYVDVTPTLEKMHDIVI